jgi:hypothetical protein
MKLTLTDILHELTTLEHMLSEDVPSSHAGRAVLQQVIDRLREMRTRAQRYGIER